MIRRTGVDVRDYVHSSIFEKESGIPLGGYPQTMYYRSSDKGCRAKYKYKYARGDRSAQAQDTPSEPFLLRQ